MKLLKPALFTSLLFFAFISTVLYSSCEKNACNDVSCQNGGSCNVGVCRCPTGYENTQCQTKSIARYLGLYTGYTTCDNSALVIDSAWITADPKEVNYVLVDLKSIRPKKLRGYVLNNEATYTIVVTNNDSFFNYARINNITLQSDTKLTIHSYNLDYRTPADSSISKCNFLGNKKNS